MVLAGEVPKRESTPGQSVSDFGRDNTGHVVRRVAESGGQFVRAEGWRGA